jgi:hypothetical protein
LERVKKTWKGFKRLGKCLKDLVRDQKTRKESKNNLKNGFCNGTKGLKITRSTWQELKRSENSFKNCAIVLTI